MRSASFWDNLRTNGSDFVLRSGDPRATVLAALERTLRRLTVGPVTTTPA